MSGTGSGLLIDSDVHPFPRLIGTYFICVLGVVEWNRQLEVKTMMGTVANSDYIF